MITDYKAQIDQILKNTEKESCSNPEFDAALSLKWKSAGRMLKHVWSSAEKMALRHGSVASCFLTDEAVYAWVREYYFLDDRETVMKERAEKAKAEQKQKEEKEKEAQYKKRALEILSKQSGWDDLPDEEKRKKLVLKIKSLKKSESCKSKKPAAKTTATHSDSAENNAVSPSVDEKENAAPDSSQDQENDPKMSITKNPVELEIELANTLDGQMNLFNLLQGGE